MSGFAGYRFLQGPEQLLLAPNLRVRTPEEYRTWHAHLVVMRGGNPWDSEGAVDASVNHGRWIAVCRWCSTAMFTRPDWAVAYCVECGARYNRGMVQFSNETDEIARLLCRRLRRDQQNWDSSQSIDELSEENRLLGYEA